MLERVLLPTAIAKIFHRVPADDVRREQLFEAERLLVEHQAAAEMHAGLSAVYRLRVERLRKDLQSTTAPTLTRAK